LRKEKFPRGTYNKLKMKKIGPCRILRKFAANAYEIELQTMLGYHRYSMLQTYILTGETRRENQMIRKKFNGKKSCPQQKNLRWRKSLNKEMGRRP
jgi:hypothetical protein